MAVHLRRNGSWAVCGVRPGATCELPYHLPGVELAQVAAMPECVLWDLLEVIDPAHVHGKSGRGWADGQGKFHRRYGLPAVIRVDGSYEWRVHGMPHRGRDLPAIVKADGERIWYVQGQKTRLGGPARILADGERQWWWQDNLHRTDGPAKEYADGRVEYWLHGGQCLPAEWAQALGRLVPQA